MYKYESLCPLFAALNLLPVNIAKRRLMAMGILTTAQNAYGASMWI